MRTSVMKFAIVGLSLVAAQAQSRAQAQVPQSFRVISPIFGQLVSFAMPSRFVVAFENTKAGHYIREAVLKGETPQAWTQMITVTGEKGASSNPNASPETFAGSIATGFKSACPDSFAAKGLGNARFGGADAFVAVIGCGRLDSGDAKHSEIALLIAIRGASDYYTVQWAERGPAIDKPPVDDEKWPTRLRDLLPINLCPIVPGEAAPYPSCVSKS